MLLCYRYTIPQWMGLLRMIAEGGGKFQLLGRLAKNVVAGIFMGSRVILREWFGIGHAEPL